MINDQKYYQISVFHHLSSPTLCLVTAFAQSPLRLYLWGYVIDGFTLHDFIRGKHLSPSEAAGDSFTQFEADCHPVVHRDKSLYKN